MVRRRLTAAEETAQIRAALRRKPDPSEPRAVAAEYLPESGVLSVTLQSGTRAEIPIALLSALRDMPDEIRRQVAVSSGGLVLRWDPADVEYEVGGMLTAAFWPKLRSAMRAMGRVGGQARSKAKARAVRANGKKGGRPRKTALTT
jgi:hypothetical protein